MKRCLSHLTFSAALALSLAVAGCANWDELGAEKKIPLSGERKALFPQGVPGVEFNAPPTQPSNSNIAIRPDMLQANPESNPQAEEDQQKSAQSKQKQKQPAQVATGSRMQVRGQKLHAEEQARQAKMREQEDRIAAQEEKAARTASRPKKSTDEDPWMETR